MPTVSIIVPVYNVENKIRRCLESIVAQSFTDFECILVDDGSTDHSGDICEEYVYQDKRFQMIHRINVGVSAARNVGIDIAKGKYIAFCDSDDYVDEDWLLKLYTAAENSHADIVQSGYYIVKDMELIPCVHEHFAELLYRNNIESILYNDIVQDKTCGYYSLWCKLFRAEIIKGNKIRLHEDMSFGEDLVFIMDCLKYAQSVKFISDCLYYYEQSETGLYNSYKPSHLRDMLYCKKIIRGQVDEFNITERGYCSLTLKYNWYLNRELGSLVRNEKNRFIKLIQLFKREDVAEQCGDFLLLDTKVLEAHNIISNELRVPKLVHKKFFSLAALYTIYLNDEKCFLRKLRGFISLVHRIWGGEGLHCSKFKSLYWSLKTGGFFIIGKKSKVHVSKGASIKIKGSFYFNKCWDGKNNQPGTLYLYPGANLIVNGGFIAYSGAYITLAENAQLKFGNGSINNNGKIGCFESISIGDGVKMSEDVIIRDSDNHTLLRDDYVKTKPIVIEDHVWIGVRCSILKGVHIGKGTVAAAGAVINKDVPEKSLIGGIPARVIKDNIEWEI